MLIAALNLIFQIFNGFMLPYPSIPRGWKWLNRYPSLSCSLDPGFAVPAKLAVLAEANVLQGLPSESDQILVYSHQD